MENKTVFMEFPPEVQQRTQGNNKQQQPQKQKAKKPAAVPVPNESFDRQPQNSKVRHNGVPVTPGRTAPSMGQQPSSLAAAAQDPNYEQAMDSLRRTNRLPQANATPDNQGFQHSFTQEQQDQMIGNAQINGMNNPVSDAEGMSIALPSRFAFYSFNDLYVKPFKARHLSKLQKAHEEQSLLPVVEAVSAVIYSSDFAGPGLGFHLTLPDFYYVLYWLRMNSFTKSSYFHTTQCNNPEHKKKVESRELDARTLEIKEIIRKADLKSEDLEMIPDPEIFKFSDTSILRFSPPTMRDVLDFIENPKMQDDAQRSEFSYLAQLASHVQGKDQWLTIDQRVQFLEEADGDTVQQIQEYEDLLEGYGIKESIKVTCKVCGHQRTSNLVLDAHSFLQHRNT